jgi:thiamine-phosphate pyrophosphorylase
MKTASAAARLETARRVRAITAGSQTLFMVNDDPDLAVAAGADGVHLGQDDEPLGVARRRCPSLRIFGLSTHSPSQVDAAIALRPDYIGVGPVFPTPSKAQPDPTLGLEVMGRMVAAAVAAGITPVAIGGIDEENLPSVLAHGATNYAVIRAVCAATDPLAAIRRLQRLEP